MRTDGGFSYARFQTTAWEKARAQLEAEGKKDYTINVVPHCGGVIAEEPAVSR